MEVQSKHFVIRDNKISKTRKFRLIHQAILQKSNFQEQPKKQKRNHPKTSSSPNMFTDVDMNQLQGILNQPTDQRPVGMSREVLTTMQQSHKYQRQKLSSRRSLQAKARPNVSKANISYEQTNQKQIIHRTQHKNQTVRTNQMFKIHRSKTIKYSKSTKLNSDSAMAPTFHMTQANSPMKPGLNKTKIHIRDYTGQKKINLTQCLEKISKQNNEYVNRKALLGQLDYSDQLQRKFGQKYFQCILRDNYKETLLNTKSAFVYQLKDNIKVTPFLRKIYKKRPDILIRERMVVKGNRYQGKTVTLPVQSDQFV